jgi:SAM-dependent methyltransferase
MHDPAPGVRAAHDAHASDVPSPWVVRFAPLVPPGARLLDFASGTGRHARFFAGRDARVLAVDRDASVLERLRGVANVTLRTLDLEGDSWPLAGERFDAIVVTNYLHRPHFAALLDTLADDGVLLYETFASGNEAYGRPSNPAFLLQRDELAERVRGRLVVVAFEQGRVVEGARTAVVQRLAAVGPGRTWPPSLS